MNTELVKQGYNTIADKYLEYRGQFNSINYLEKLNARLRLGSVVLDLGCGAGKPIDVFLAGKGHRVVGLDISEQQIELARRNVPAGNYSVKDMASLEKSEYKVDAAVSFYAIFHISRETHLALFEKINSYLPEGGLILVTMGASEREGIEDFHGVEMYWSQYGSEKNREIIEKAGFKIIFDEIDRSAGERHQVIMGIKE